MKKSALAMLSAAVLMVAVVPAFAAGWVESGSTWKYLNKDNTYATDCWKESNGYKFWLDGSGNMARNSLIEDGDDVYYVNEDGVRMSDMWLKTELDGEAGWLYFQSNGKAKSDGWLTVGDKKYHFTDHLMDYGWYEDGDKNYYLGGEDEGWCSDGWKYLYDDDDHDEGWYYFNTSGKMVQNTERTIGGKKYAFDETGRMIEGWAAYTATETVKSTVSIVEEVVDGVVVSKQVIDANGQTISYEQYTQNQSGAILATSSNATPTYNTSSSEVEKTVTTTTYKYFMPEKGYQANGWKYLDDLDADEYGKDTEEGWYYFRNGRPYSLDYKTTAINSEYGIAKVGSKYYCFDADGKMYTGVVYGTDGTYFYFRETEGSSEGQMVTGKVRITDSSDLEDDTYYYFVNTGSVGEKGKSYTGVKDGYLYNNGELVKADDDKYEVVQVSGLTYVVNKSGKIKTSGTFKDDNDVKWKVEKNSAGGYTVTKIDS